MIRISGDSHLISATFIGNRSCHCFGLSVISHIGRICPGEGYGFRVDRKLYRPGILVIAFTLDGYRGCSFVCIISIGNYFIICSFYQYRIAVLHRELRRMGTAVVDHSRKFIHCDIVAAHRLWRDGQCSTCLACSIICPGSVAVNRIGTGFCVGRQGCGNLV